MENICPSGKKVIEMCKNNYEDIKRLDERLDKLHEGLHELCKEQSKSDEEIKLLKKGLEDVTRRLNETNQELVRLLEHES